MRRLSIAMLFSITFIFSSANAALLPDVENIQTNAQTLSWDEQPGATGYNIVFNGGYYDTVRGALSYELNESGSYTVIAFNDSGDYGSDYTSERLEFVAGTTDASVSYNYQYNVLFVYKTCKDVGPGESCIAACPSNYTPDFNQTKYIAYMSGGACSTSDIVEADSYVSPNSYKCTVPTYSGEVVAQAICPFR